MTDENKQPQYRNTGFNQTVHDWVEKALKNITDACAYADGLPCPAIWETNNIVSALARGRRIKNSEDAAAREYSQRWAELNSRYGGNGKKEDPHRNMSGAEATERVQVLMDFLFDVGALQMAEREQEWREERLIARDKMMSI